MQEDRFWLLASLHLSSEATQQEQTELEALIRANPELGLRLDMLMTVWNQQHAGLSSKKGDAWSKHLQRLSNHLSEPVLQYENPSTSEVPVERGRTSKLRKLRVPLAAAAAILLLFIFGYLANLRKDNSSSAQNTISTKLGSKSKIQLPDGSQVWLNADSRLTYDESFLASTREVQLMGEAYFDVTKDMAHPFIIHTSSIDIRVLGTTLNVRSYANEKNTEAVLVGGSIEVIMHNSPDKRIILKPNEKLVVSNEKAIPAKKTPSLPRREEEHPIMTLSKVHLREKDSIATDILWVKNKLAFDKETLENVALKIERWYDVKVNITDEKIKKTEYSAVFTDESLKQVMEALRLSGNFRYSINRKEVTIRP